MAAVESRAGPAEIRALLAEGAYVDGIDGRAKWPLYAAAGCGHAKAVRQLLDGGADVNPMTPSQATATEDGSTPLCMAAQQRACGVVRQLLDGGADVNKATTDSGWTPLHTAAVMGHAEVARQPELLDGGADVNKATTESGSTPLYAAAHNGHVSVVRQLLDGGADVNKATTKNGNTPLFVAARHTRAT